MRHPRHCLGFIGRDAYDGRATKDYGIRSWRIRVPRFRARYRNRRDGSITITRCTASAGTGRGVYAVLRADEPRSERRDPAGAPAVPGGRPRQAELRLTRQLWQGDEPTEAEGELDVVALKETRPPTGGRQLVIYTPQGFKGDLEAIENAVKTVIQAERAKGQPAKRRPTGTQGRSRQP